MGTIRLTYKAPTPRIADVAHVAASKPEIEITQAMIDAGAKILWNDIFLDIGPFTASNIAEAIISAALKAYARENSEGDCGGV